MTVDELRTMLSEGRFNGYDPVVVEVDTENGPAYVPAQVSLVTDEVGGEPLVLISGESPPVETS